MRLPRWPMSMQLTTLASLSNPGASEAIGSSGASAASDRVILLGTIDWEDGASHTPAVLHWRNATSSALSATVRVSFRGIDLTAGPVGRDDGVISASGTQVNPVSNTNYATALSGGSALAHGSRQALVWDFSAYTSGSARTPAGLTAGAGNHGTFFVFYNATAGTYALVTGASMLPAVTIEADDGTFGRFLPGLPLVTASPSTVSFANNSTPDERSIAFTLDGPADRIDFGWLIQTVAGGAFDLVLYVGTTELASLAFDDDTWDADGTVRLVDGSFAGAFAAGEYRLSLRPTTTTNVTIATIALTAGHLATLGAELLGQSTRTDGGSWSTPDDTVLPALAWVDVHYSSVAGSGGGLLTHPGMSGGING